MSILLLQNAVDELLLQDSSGAILLQADSPPAIGMGFKARPASALPKDLLLTQDGKILFLQNGMGGLLLQSDSADPKTTVVVRVTKPGSGYTSAPAVAIAGVTARAVINAAGQVTGVVITAITGTPVDPLVVTFTGGGGHGAEAIARTISVASQVATSDPPFQVRTENYGAITIDSVQDDLAGNSGGPGTPRTVSLPEPPLPQPVLEPGDLVLPDNPTLADLQGLLKRVMHARAWNAWFQQVQRILAAGGTGFGSAAELQFFCPSVDEIDAEWFAKFDADVDDTTDPLTVTCKLVGESRFGMQFQVLLGGTGYSSASPPTLTISGVGGSGSGAAAVPVIDDASGQIVGVNVGSSGFGYIGPLSVSITGGTGSGALIVGSIGRQWAIGDYVLVNNPAIVAGLRSYEILKITDLEGSGTTIDFTFERRPAGAPAGQSQYGSLTRSHATGIPFYRLINKVFTAAPKAGQGPQSYVFPWPNMTVPAVKALLPGKDPITLNFSPRVYLPNVLPLTLDPRTNPPAPGIRTMNGAGYISMGTIGALAVGQNAIARIVGVQAPESLRCLYMRTRTAPVGSVPFGDDGDACIVAYVVYISPSGAVGLIDTLVIDEGNLDSYSSGNVPDGRVMPYHAFFPTQPPNYNWPPNRLPIVAPPAIVGGVLVKPLATTDVDARTTILFEPDGQIDFIIAQVGATTPGTDLIFAVQN